MSNRDKQTIICRCEDVTREQIVECIERGYNTINEIKRVTRAGMGSCQGRTCRNLIAAELSRVYDLPMEEIVMPTYRPPVKAIDLGALADAYCCDNSDDYGDNDSVNEENI